MYLKVIWVRMVAWATARDRPQRRSLKHGCHRSTAVILSRAKDLWLGRAQILRSAQDDTDGVAPALSQAPARPSPGEKLDNMPAPFSGHLEHGHMAGAFQLHQFGVSYQPVKSIGVGHGNKPVGLPPDDKRWTFHSLQTALQPGIIARVPGQGCQGCALAVLREQVISIHLGGHER